MVKLRFRLPLAIVLLLAAWWVAACQSSTPDNTAAPIRAVNINAEQDGTNLLIDMIGQVDILRPGWEDFHPAAFGMTVHRSDLLRVTGDARVLILCDDLSLWEPPHNTTTGINFGCAPGATPALNGDSRKSRPSRNAVDESIPAIVAPRATKLLNANPRLEWRPVVGVMSYTVIVRSEELWWEKESTASEMDYDGEPFVSGQVYKLVVEADNGRSSVEEDIQDLGFSIISPAEREQLAQDIAQVKAHRLPDDAVAYATAHLYFSHGLYADAVALLESLVEEHPDELMISYWLGKAYGEMKLWQPALTHLESAVDIAQKRNDLGTIAELQVALAKAYYSLNDEVAAAEWHSAAMKSYAQLGLDTVALKTLEDSWFEPLSE